jgi:hypothetical protein
MSLVVNPNIELEIDGLFPEDIEINEVFSLQLYNPASVAIFKLKIKSQSVADFADPTASAEESGPPPSFNGKFEGTLFNAVVEVEVTMPVDELTGPVGVATLTSAALLDYSVDCDGFTGAQQGNDIIVSGTPFNVFDSVYRFIMPDGSIKALPADTTEDFVSIVEWSPPTIKVRELSHKFSIIANYVEDGVSRTRVMTLVMPQTIRWNFTTAVNSFQQLVANGRRL